MFSPTYDDTMRLIWRVCNSFPSPKSSTPALFDATVNSDAPWSHNAWIRCSGIPHRPNPPTCTAAPSGMSATAADADGHTFVVDADDSARRAAADGTIRRSIVFEEILRRIYQWEKIGQSDLKN